MLAAARAGDLDLDVVAMPAVATEGVELDVAAALAVDAAVAASMAYLVRNALVELDLSMPGKMLPTTSLPDSVWIIVPTGCLLENFVPKRLEGAQDTSSLMPSLMAVISKGLSSILQPLLTCGSTTVVSGPSRIP